MEFDLQLAFGALGNRLGQPFQCNGTDSGGGVIWAMISLFGWVWAKAGALPSAKIPARPPAP